MKKVTLKNGLTVIFDKRPSKSVAIQILVKVGSNNEPEHLNGISHFLEHMVFEGTKNRTQMQIANEIERLGGELNAATSTEFTMFYARVLNKHFSKALDVLADIIQNPLFDQKALDKERKVILDEINMVNDEPRFYQWILFNKTLYEKFPAKNPTYGNKTIIKQTTRKDIFDYYSKFYVPNNIIITIVGNVKNPFGEIQKKFMSFERKALKKQEFPIEPKQIAPKAAKEQRSIQQSYLVLGYKTKKRSAKESLALDIIRAHLGRGQSGRLFEEIRGKRGLAYDVGVGHEACVEYGTFAVYCSTQKQNIEQIKEIIMQEFRKLQQMGLKELDECKSFIEGQYILQCEDNLQQAENLSFWEYVNDCKMSSEYVKKILRVRLNDVHEAAKMLNENNTFIVIEQE
jgi:predicted Zn-dependent peptidase